MTLEEEVLAVLLYLLFLLFLILHIASDQVFVHPYRVDEVATCPEMISPIRLLLQCRIALEQQKRQLSPLENP